jgi:CheY-like chemotaxis protein
MQQAEWAELIIMDLRMPDAVTGLGLIRQIRHSGHGGPVIVVSGWPDELYGQPEERMVSRVMVKPVPIAELFEVIRQLTA